MENNSRQSRFSREECRHKYSGRRGDLVRAALQCDDLTGVIKRVHDIGAVRRVEIELGGETPQTIIEVDALRNQQWRVGQAVGLRPEQYRPFPNRG
jgi:hypothetical protein